MRHLAVLIFVVFFCVQAQAPVFQSSAAVAAIFDQEKASGTFVLFDVSAQRLIGYNHPRAQTRYSPASTFKIPNSLIGLSTQAVSSVDEIFPYDGKPTMLASWKHDMGLREAIKVSNLPVYQQLARRIGLARMKSNLARLDYGNGVVGPTVDTFWLDGTLKISAIEQTRFLARLAQGQLPFPAEAQAQVRDIAMLEQGNGWTLYGKTGWFARAQPNIGWWVGWLEQDGKLYSFALNMDITGNDRDLARRIAIGKASLRALGLLAPS